MVDERAYLLHPVLGVPRPLCDRMLPPLTESMMPRTWLALTDDERDRRLRSTWWAAVDHAVSRGVDRVLVDATMADREVQTALAATARTERGGLVVDFRSPADAAAFLRALVDHPVEVRVEAHGEPVLSVKGTWDGMVAHGEPASTIEVGAGTSLRSDDLAPALCRVEGVSGVTVTHEDGPVRDYLIEFPDHRRDLVVWHHSGYDSARVFCLHARIDDLPGAWVVEFTSRIARGEFRARHRGSVIEARVGGELRRFG
jgi:hypothetical protein